MNYKDIHNNRAYLDFHEDILNECLNTDFVHFDFENPDIKKHFNEICDFLKNVYLPQRVFNLSIDVPVYFILKKNGKNYYYKGTPERIRYIMECLSRHNFTEFHNLDKEIFNYEISEDLEMAPISEFSIHIFPKPNIKKEKKMNTLNK